MSDLGEQLRHLIDRSAEPVTLDEVCRTGLTPDPFRRPPSHGRSWWLLGLATAALVVIGIVVAVDLGQPSRTRVDTVVPEPVDTTSPVLTAPPSTPPTTSPVPVNTWRTMARAPIDGRNDALTLWTGSEMLVFAGESGPWDGAAYNPATDTWRALSPAPQEPRGMTMGRRTVVGWTGTEAIFVGLGRTFAVAYNPTTDTWRALAPGPPFTNINDVISIWTGTEMVFVDQLAATSRPTVRALDPIADSWREIEPFSGIPTFRANNAFWTGQDIVVTGGRGILDSYGNFVDTPDPVVVAFDPATGAVNELDGGGVSGSGPDWYGGPSAWTGRELIFLEGTAVTLFNPGTNSWRTGSPVPCQVPDPSYGTRLGGTASLWSGAHLFVTCSNDRTAAYDPTEDRWSVLDIGTYPPFGARRGSSIAWDGSTLLMWGGVIDSFRPTDGAMITIEVPR